MDAQTAALEKEHEAVSQLTFIIYVVVVRYVSVIEVT